MSAIENTFYKDMIEGGDIPSSIEIDIDDLGVVDEDGNKIDSPDFIDFVENELVNIKTRINLGEYDEDYISFDAELDNIINGYASYNITVDTMSQRLVVAEL